MGFEAKVLADSISPAGHRLTTLEATFPRFVLAEFNTHRVFSRNSASSRAIPVAKQIRRLLEDPYVPIEFGSNQPGMQAGPPLEGAAREAAEAEWLRARDAAVRHVLGLIANPELVARHDDLLACLEEAEGSLKSPPADWLNVHKQVSNRLLEPFMWHTVIVSSTTWENFWNLRCHPDAQPEIQLVAKKMREAVDASAPTPLQEGEWHLPLIRPEDREEEVPTDQLVKISVGRCARVSYLTHAGIRDLGADLFLYDRLLESGHMSPMEHVARPMTSDQLAAGAWCGNFEGWCSHRKLIPGEENPLASGSIEEVELSEDERLAGAPSGA
jgi:Thymidylate synthase complementing protein